MNEAPQKPSTFNKHSVSQKLMGSAFELAILSDNAEFAKQQLEIGVAEIKRLEDLLSEFLPDSDTYTINYNAFEKAVKIAPETFALIQRCLGISSLSQGYFDITAAALKSLFRFKNEDFSIPSSSTIQSELKKVGFQKLKLNPSDYSVQFLDPGMKISFAAVGKGYASDAVKRIWLKNGVKNGYINASGDMNVLNQSEKPQPWNVSIAHPDNKKESALSVPLINFAIATSGDYEQHFTHNNIRYSHNINPITGYPISGVKSVSVLSPSAELSDALATAVYAMGIKKGLSFIQQLPQTHCIIISSENEMYFSNRIKIANQQVVFS